MTCSTSLLDASEPVALDGRTGLDERMHQLLDRTVAFAALLTLDGLLKDVSQNALDVAGLSRAEVIGRPFPDCFWWSHDNTVQEQLRKALRDARAGITSRYDTLVRTIGDGRLAIAFQVSPIVDADGKPIELVASAVDITDRIRSQQRAEDLLAEMDHRMKSLLATVQAMARVIQRSKDSAVAFDAFLVRLDALAAAHKVLAVGPSAHGSFGPLARRLLAPYVDVGPVSRIAIAGPSTRLACDRVKMLGLCLYELATNATMHGALSNEEGQVALTLVMDEHGGATLTWHETGGPAVSPPERTSFGTRFVTETLEAMFGGPVRFDYDPCGLRVTVSGPAVGLFLSSGESVETRAP